MTGGLDQLSADIRRDMARICVPAAAWTKPPRDPERLDAVVVGAGQMGLAASFALLRNGITRHIVMDGAARDHEGPWVTYARMQTLRSPNHLVGPAQDIPSLTFRAYYEARFGVGAWEGFGKIPNAMWQDYLGFFRDALALPLQSGVVLRGFEPDCDGLKLHLHDESGERTVRTRHLVLATGRDGLGGPNLPDWVPEGDTRFQHSTEAVDFAGLAGQRVAVVGASASAFDNAAAALEGGAAAVHMLMRRPSLPTFNRFKLMISPGFTHGFPSLSDEMRLKMLQAAFSTAVAPPHESVARIAKAANFYLHTGASVSNVTDRGGALQLDLGDAAITADHVILGTGFKVDLSLRPEFAALNGKVVLWGERPLREGEAGAFARHPYLNSDFSFTPRGPDDAWVGSVHALNIGAMASLGLLSGDIPGIGEAAARMGRGVAEALFLEDAEWHLSRVADYADYEIQGDELESAEQRAAQLALQRAS